MLDCPRCRKRVPEILGAPEQRCPHCGHAFRPYESVVQAAAPAEPQGPGARPVQAGGDGGDAAGGRFAPADAVAAGFRVYGRHIGTFLVLWLPVLVLDLAIAWSGLAWQARHGLLDLQGADVMATPTGERRLFMQLLGFILPFYLGLWVLKLAYWGAQTPLVNTALAGGQPTARAGFHVLRERWRALFAAGGAFAVILSASAFLALAPIFYVFTLDPADAVGGAGFLLTLLAVLLAAPFLAFLYWYLYAPAAASEPGMTLARAFAASRALAKEKRPTGFLAAVLLLMLAAFMASYFVGKVGIAVAAVTAPTWRFHFEEAFAAVARWTLAPLTASIVAAYWLKARAPVEAAEPAEPAESDAPAASPETGSVAAGAEGGAAQATAAPRLKTTKCPACTTAFPYKPDPEGASVRVECPTCGKRGLIR